MASSNIWGTKKEKELTELVENGASVEELAEHFHKTTTAIEIKVNRLGLKILRKNRNWNTKDKEQFKLDWVDSSISMRMLMKKYKRNKNSLVIKAQRMKLGPRNENRELLTVTDIMEEMKVSRDRIMAWIKLGLKTKKNKAGKGKYLVDTKDLLAFLLINRTKFNASIVSDYLFADEPDWFREKRRLDSHVETCEYREYEVWTTTEQKRVKDLVKLGYDIKKIAKTMNKTEYGVRRQINDLGIEYKSGVYWSDEQLDIVEKYHDTHTIKEMRAMMKNKRTEKAIQAKCEELEYNYHISDACVNREKIEL